MIMKGSRRSEPHGPTFYCPALPRRAVLAASANVDFMPGEGAEERSRGTSQATALLSTKHTYATDEPVEEEKGLHRFSSAGMAVPANEALRDDRDA